MVLCLISEHVYTQYRLHGLATIYFKCKYLNEELTGIFPQSAPN